MRTSNDILLSRIVFGSTLVRIKNKQYVYRKASKEINYKADLLYEETLQDHIYDGWLTMDKAPIVLIENGLWSNQHEFTLKTLDKQLEDLKVLLFQNYMFTKKKQEYINKIKNIKKQINNLISTKHSIDQNTIEAYAARIRNEYLIMNCLYNNTNTKKVFTKNKKNDSNFLNDCANEIAKNIPDINTLKALVKSEIWKSYWNASGKNAVFGSDISDYSDEQRVLINLSRMYDSVYEHPECPSDEIILDDDALDGWMITQKRKREKDKKVQSISSLGKSTNAGEVYLMASDQTEAQEILDFNSLESRKVLKERQEQVLLSEKPVDAILLPDVQRDLSNSLAHRPNKKG